MSRTIYITEPDRLRLFKLISEEKEFNPRNKAYLKDLEQELNRAETVTPDKVPHDTITMNSKVVLKDLDTAEEMIYTLTYPNEANLREGKISVLAPVGTAILGYCIGDVIEWKVPDGAVHLKVERILYQPEAAGDFDL